MGVFGGWVLDARKFLVTEELIRLRKHVCRQVGKAGFKRRLPWLEWFMVELALETGLRVAEMAALVCSDLITDSTQCGVLVRRGKGGRSRFVRIRSHFAGSCEDYLNWKTAVGEPVSDDAPVLRSSASGGHMTTRGLQKMFSRLCKRVGITGHSVHHCRHTYASYLYRSSKRDLRLVQEQLGHSSVRTTEVYAHVFDNDAKSAVENLYA